MVENLPANAGNLGHAGLIVGSRRNNNQFQKSCLENPMDRGAWWGTVYRVTKSQT